MKNLVNKIIIVAIFILLILISYGQLCSAEDLSIDAGEESNMSTPAKIEIKQITPDTSQIPISAKEKEETVEIEKRLKVKEKREEILPFGYKFFELAPTTFAPFPFMPVPPTYTLAPGDVIRLTFWSKIGQETTYALKVNYEGYVYIPMLGKIQVMNLTLSQFEKIVLKKLGQQFPQIEGYITLEKLRTITVYVMGEAQRPGGYTISGLSTVFNALYVAGGPNERGSMRSIKLIRNNKTVGVIDLYDYLIDGDRAGDFKLQSGDIIFIPVVGPRVTILGEVKRPAIYELKGKERLLDLIELAGGIKSSAYLEQLQIERIKENKERIIIDIKFKDLSSPSENVLLRDGDIVRIFEVLAEKTNVVKIEGPVNRPGVYQFKENMRVLDVIKKAEGLSFLESIYLDRADIFRTNEDGTVSLISFNLRKAMEEDENENLKLQKFDKVKIYSPEEAIFLDKTVRAQGAVKTPGVYPRTEDMKVLDLINLAGGVLPESSEYVELARANTDKDITIFELNLSKILNKDKTENMVLKDRDVVTIKKKGEFKRIPNIITIEGEVKYPGVYALKNDQETLHSILQRAGGLTSNAFPEGAIFKRRMNKLMPEEQQKTVSAIKDTLNYLLQQQYEIELAKYGVTKEPKEKKEEKIEIPAAVVSAAPEAEELTKITMATETATEVISAVPEIKEERIIRVSKPREVEEIIESRRIAMNLRKVINKEEDIVLKSGDYIYIPEKPLTIAVTGAVINPGNIIYEEGKEVGYYIKKSGGYSEDANRGKIILVKANGEVFPLAKGIKVNRGDVIVVPPKPVIIKERKDWWDKTKDIVKLIGDTATAVFIIRSLEEISK